MGTRADFYIGRGPAAEWLGSIGWDGYPDGLTIGDTREEDLTKIPILSARTPTQFRKAIEEFSLQCDHFTRPDEGWPWPWKDSNLTDYAYAFDKGRVWITGNGEWITVERYMKLEADEAASDAYWNGRGGQIDFPDMSARKKMATGKKSGLIIIGG